MSEHDPLIGATVGPYEIREKIGEGRWGGIYEAFQRSTHRTVALRVLSPKLVSAPDAIHGFREEARAKAQLSHSNLVTIYEAGYSDGLHFCASEFMDGPPLTQFLRGDNSVDERRLLQTIIDAARALEFLWKRQIPHQPPDDANILTNARGTVKLINILPVDAPPSAAPQDDVLALGVILGHIVNEISPVSRPVGELVERMVAAQDRQSFATLTELAAAAEELERQLFPPAKRVRPMIPKIEPRHTKQAMIAAFVAWWRGR
jgi:serine/threonine protein kinase